MKDTTTGRGASVPPSVTHLARRAWRQAPLFLVVLALGLAVTAVLVSQTEQVYRSEAVLLYRQVARGAPGEGDSARRAGTRLQDMLLARERLHRVANGLRLYPELTDRDAAVDEMRKKVAFHVRDGSTFLVSFDAASPALAQAVVARLTETLIKDNAAHRTLEAEETRRLLDEERRSLEAEVRQREAALARFLQLHPEAAFAREAMAPPDDSALRAMRTELSQLRSGSRESAATGGVRMDPEATVSRRRAELELDQARADLAEKRARLTELHPDFIAARERLRRSEERFNPTSLGASEVPAASAADNAPARTRAGQDAAQVVALEREVARLESGQRNTGRRIDRDALKREVEMDGLRQELAQSRQRLTGLEDKQFQTTLVARLETSGEMGQLSILDPASRPGLPTADRRKKVAAGGAALALALALGLALLKARIDDRIHDRADAEWLAGQAVLVTVGASPRRAKRAHG